MKITFVVDPLLTICQDAIFGMPYRKMIRCALRSSLLTLIICVMGISLAAAAEHETGELIDRISTDTLTGLRLSLVNLYNDNRGLYAVVVTACMAFFGIIIGLVTEAFLRLCGLKTTKMEKRE